MPRHPSERRRVPEFVIGAGCGLVLSLGIVGVMMSVQKHAEQPLTTFGVMAVYGLSVVVMIGALVVVWGKRSAQ